MYAIYYNKLLSTDELLVKKKFFQNIYTMKTSTQETSFIIIEGSLVWKTISQANAIFFHNQ